MHILFFCLLCASPAVRELRTIMLINNAVMRRVPLMADPNLRAEINLMVDMVNRSIDCTAKALPSSPDTVRKCWHDPLIDAPSLSFQIMPNGPLGAREYTAPLTKAMGEFVVKGRPYATKAGDRFRLTRIKKHNYKAASWRAIQPDTQS